MVVSTADRGRDAYTPDPVTPKGGLSMQPQLTTSLLFGDSRLPSRFWAKVRVLDSGCWEWQGYKAKNGYGRFRWGEKSQYAHRIAYKELIGPFPSGLQSDHLCRNRACVNPAHVEPVSARTNILRGIGLIAENARKAHCIQGHPYDATNTYRSPNTGWRGCRICHRERSRKAYWQRKEARL